MVYRDDLKSSVERHEGSSPSSPTICECDNGRGIEKRINEVEGCWDDSPPVGQSIICIYCGQIYKVVEDGIKKI